MGDIDWLDDAHGRSQAAGSEVDRASARKSLCQAIRDRMPPEQVMAAAQLVVTAELNVALEGRAVIDQAKGILMAGRRCTATEAFGILREISQDTQTKLHDVAQALVESATDSRVAVP
jgi:hypothetical protein